MSQPKSSPELTQMIRTFIRELREHVTAKALEGDAEDVIERLFAAASAVAAALLLALPKTRNKAGWIGALLAIAMRFFNRKDHLDGPARPQD